MESVDTTFGTNGKTVVDIGEYDQAYAVAIQNDGKILIGGS